MATRTSIATDNFNRASLGTTDWTQLTAGGTGPVVITSSTVIEGSDGSGISAAVWKGSGTFTDDQYASIEVTDLSFGTTSYGQGVICRASTDTDSTRDYYYFVVYSDRTATLGKVVNGTNTNLNNASVTSFFTSTGTQTIELECEGTTIRAMRNGTALGGSWTQTDSSLTTGKPGVCPKNNGAGCTGDNWIGGNLTSSSATKKVVGSVLTESLVLNGLAR